MDRAKHTAAERRPHCCRKMEWEVQKNTLERRLTHFARCSIVSRTDAAAAPALRLHDDFMRTQSIPRGRVVIIVIINIIIIMSARGDFITVTYFPARRIFGNFFAPAHTLSLLLL